MSYLQHSEIEFHDDYLDLSGVMIGQKVQEQLEIDLNLDTNEQIFNFNTGQFSTSPQQISIPHEVPIEAQNNEEENPQDKGSEREENLEQEKSEREENFEQKRSEEKRIETNKHKIISKQYLHVQGKRRPKGKKNRYQAEVGGYWTKNFLPFGKNHHFNCIQEKMGQNFLDTHQELKKIKEKSGINLSDFVALYKCEELKQMWEQFFAKKVLYRELMLSRTKTQYRVIYVQFLHVFEKAFKTKVFQGISRILLRSQEEMSDKVHEQFNRAQSA